ncbi:MAG TPA: ABC transporter permease [Terriglobia bacterium]|nr:ABC transporter permease [Terriglobia bacterium]
MNPRRWYSVIGMRLRAVLQRDRVERDLDKELRFHLQQQIEENVAAGMSPDEARYAAMRRLGGAEQIKEECRDMRRTAYLEDLGKDLRYTLRALRKSPGFAVAIVLSLGLSIGANSAIFSAIDGVLLKPLPYPRADRIARLFFSSNEYPEFSLNPFDFRDLRVRAHSFEALAAFTRGDVQLSGSGEPVRLAAFRVTAGYFQVLGLVPALGRAFEEKEELPGNGRVVVLSNRIWRTQFGAAPDIVGRKITLDLQPFTVVGVMPPGAEHPGNEYHALPYGDSVDAWWPFTFEGDPSQRGSHYVEGIGRLKPGVTPAQAQAELNTLLGEIGHEHGGYGGWHMLVIPLYREIVGPDERMLLVLLGAVGLVLLIACANAANLLLARATARQREIAVRMALGAARARLLRQMLTESLLLALVGGGFGALLAPGGVRALVALLPAGFPRADSIQVNASVFGFTLLVALAAGVLFGLAPAMQSSRVDLQQALREGARGATGSRHHQRLRDALVVAEVGLASVLLVGAGLMLRSFVNLVRMDPGFRPEHVLTASLSLPDTDYKTSAGVAHFYDQLVANLAAAPGVKAAGAGSDLPWTGYDENDGGFTIEGEKPAPGEEFHARYHVATPDYFRALGIPLVRGRFFTEGDRTDAPNALIVNETMARVYWRKRDAVGGRVAFSDNPKEKDWMTVVGVVGDVKDRPDAAGAEPAFWWPMLQVPFAQMSVAVRADSGAAQLANELRREVHRLDPTLAVADVRLMDQIADAGVSTARFAFFLVGLFAGLAITLAAIGTYGVISYSVNQRTHEFGMRMALGAGRRDVLRLVLSQGVRLAMAGVVLGAAGAAILARVLRSLIFEVSPADPLTFAAVVALVLAVAVVACYIPARRATDADPMVALRSE